MFSAHINSKYPTLNDRYNICNCNIGNLMFYLIYSKCVYIYIYIYIYNKCGFPTYLYLIYYSKCLCT